MILRQFLHTDPVIAASYIVGCGGKGARRFDRIQDGIKRGLTLDQIKGEKPTRDYDPRFGRTTGPWTTDMFIEAAYRSLGGK